MKENLRTFFLVLFFSAFFLQGQQCLSIIRNSDVDNSKSSNRIAIAAVGDSVTSEISMRAGRAPYYLVFDKKGVFLKSIKNPSQMQGGGASSVVVDLFIKESVKTVIAGKFGDKMKKQLKANKIKYHERTGITKEIVETIIKNKRSKDE
ncbi:MAG: NifB/NifX family molybdenum-iron cluster-binding protein [Bacteroidales bacterium]|nr:NifB/NifX family molybdenum-iron cluster-binding protein [Bacteroidales bacterium]